MATVREQCEKRLEGLKTIRRPMEGEWQEIARFANPNAIRMEASETDKRRRKGQTIYDSHAIKAFRTLTGGMTSGLSSESRPWFSLGTQDEEMMEDPEVAAWLAEVEKRVGSFLASTNFYSAVKVGYSQMGCFGTEACIMDEHWRAGAVCHPLFIGQYWIARNDARQVDTLYRDAPMTVKQAVDQFGKDVVSSRVKTAYDQSRYDQIVKVVHAIELNPDFEFGRLDRRGKQFRSVYWDSEDGGSDKLLRLSGYEEQPFWAPSWDDPGPDTWGTCPGHETLADMRELQMQAKRKGEATDWVINPEKVTPASIKLKNRPGAITTAASVDKDSVIIPYQLPYQAIGVIGEDVQRCREAIDTGSYADLFMAITNMPGVQPRNIEEIAARNEEKLTQLGPVVTHVNRDKLQIALDRTFGIMMRGKLLPPAPPQIHGQEIKVNFISILTQLQRSIGVGQIQETVGFVGNLAGVFPEALDKIDIDAAIDEFADRKGAPQKIIRSTKDAAKLRAARQQAQQTQQMMDNMGNARDGAAAAQLLAQTADRSQAPLAPAGMM